MNLLQKYKKDIPPLPKSLWHNPLHFVAFGFGAGALPFAPGTFGTLMAIPFYWLLQHLPSTAYLIIVIAITIGSIIISDRVAKEINVHDHPGMCLDEIVGYLITMLYAPKGILWIVIGFLLFRLFDIWKPWPIRLIDEQVHGGLGIILDDVLAGIYSFVLLQSLHWILL